MLPAEAPAANAGRRGTEAAEAAVRQRRSPRNVTGRWVGGLAHTCLATRWPHGLRNAGSQSFQRPWPDDVTAGIVAFTLLLGHTERIFRLY
jgi:hypothetical protein